MLEAIAQAGYKPGEQVGICLDPASSEFFKDGKYIFKKSDKSAAHLASRWWSSGPTGCASIRPSSRSKTAWPKTTGPAGSC